MLSDATFKSLSLLAASALLLTGCWIKKTACRGLHNQMGESCAAFQDDDGSTDASQPQTVSASSQPEDNSGFVTPAAPTTTTQETIASSGFSLARVTPEQLSNNLVTAVNFGAEPDELRWQDDNSGQTHDYLQLLFGVPLGGIDFETASVRDPSTKAQTLLVSRLVAMQITQMSLGKEWNKTAANRVVFNRCDFNADRPFRDADKNTSLAVQNAIKAGEARWNEQVEELFFRFFARPPNTTEVTAIRTAFLAGMDAEGYPLAGWVPVIYALIASQEFWHQ